MLEKKFDSSKLDFVKSVVLYLRNFNIIGEVALFIAAQFALESSFGSSDLAKKNNNFCGMKVPHLRLSTAKNFGSSQEWSVYLSLYDCLIDYILCLQSYRFTYKTFASLELFMYRLQNSGYCPEKGYINKIKSIYLQLKNLKKDGN